MSPVRVRPHVPLLHVDTCALIVAAKVLVTHVSVPVPIMNVQAGVPCKEGSD